MARRTQHAAAWIFVNLLFTISGGSALFVGVRNARCDLPDLFDSENGPFGRAADDGVDHQVLYDIARWTLLGGMVAATAVTVFAMVISWRNQIHLRTLLAFMGIAFAQFVLALVVFGVQIESNVFCGADLPTIAVGAAIALIALAPFALHRSSSRWSSADLADDPTDSVGG